MLFFIFLLKDLHEVKHHQTYPLSLSFNDWYIACYVNPKFLILFNLSFLKCGFYLNTWFFALSQKQWSLLVFKKGLLITRFPFCLRGSGYMLGGSGDTRIENLTPTMGGSQRKFWRFIQSPLALILSILLREEIDW